MGDNWIQPVVMLAIGGAITYFINIKLDRHRRQQDLSFKKQIEVIQNRRDRETRRDHKILLLSDGLKAILRDKILMICEARIEQGSIYAYDRDNLSRMYDAYHALGGNDVASTAYEKVLQLPVKTRE